MSNLFENLQLMHEAEKDKLLKESDDEMTEEEINYIANIIKQHKNDPVITFSELKRRHGYE